MIYAMELEVNLATYSIKAIEKLRGEQVTDWYKATNEKIIGMPRCFV